MTVTIDEMEDFIEVFENQEIEKVKEKDLRKAIRNFWNVATRPTVNDRIETLDDEDLIAKVPHSNSWKIQGKQDNELAELFKEKGKKHR